MSKALLNIDERNINVPIEPLVTIVTVCFNEKDGIGSTLESILSQTYNDFECIIVDGDSNDETLSIIKNYLPHFQKKNVDVTLISESDAGIYDAMNKGVLLAMGRWINFMNGGDCFASNDVIKRIFEIPFNADMIYGNTYLEYSGQSILQKMSDNFFLLRKMICHQSIFYKRHIFKSCDLFDLKYNYIADFDRLLKIVYGNFIVEKVDIPVSIYSLDGLTSQKESIPRIWAERLRIFEASERHLP